MFSASEGYLARATAAEVEDQLVFFFEGLFPEALGGLFGRFLFRLLR
jgi:hypothetical protein